MTSLIPGYGAIARLRRLLPDRRGLALLEFALALPIVLPVGMYGVETSNFALQQMRLSQTTLSLADNASRVGVDTNLATQQLREVDINDVLQGMRLQGKALNLTTNGRITLSSLESKNGFQWIHWQRCVGLKRGAGYDSSFGAAGRDGAVTTSFVGMGKAGEEVVAPPGSAVMFVEVNYDYTPLLSRYFLGQLKLQQIASFIVRDNRDLSSGVTNPSPEADEMTCDKYTT